MSETQIILDHLKKQDEILSELKEKIDKHLAQEELVKPAIDELISLWKGSKVLSRILAGTIGFIAAAYTFLQWAKDHIKI